MCFCVPKIFSGYHHQLQVISAFLESVHASYQLPLTVVLSECGLDGNLGTLYIIDKMYLIR